jgi:hypothetical protein
LWTVNARDEANRQTVASTRFLEGSNLLPSGATWFAAIDIDAKRTFGLFRAAYLAARSPSVGLSARQFWSDIEAESGVNFENDLFGRLKPPLLIHDFPRHALRLPLAWSFAFPIAGDAAAMRATVDRLFEYVRTRMAPTGLVRLQRDTDGIWYISAGLAGPAVTVTEAALCISFSPSALRDNLKAQSRSNAGSEPGAKPAPGAPGN